MDSMDKHEWLYVPQKQNTVWYGWIVQCDLFIKSYFIEDMLGNIPRIEYYLRPL